MFTQTIEEMRQATKLAKMSTPSAVGKGILSGTITGMLEISLTYPTEYVKTQLQLDEKEENKQFEGNIDCIKKTVNQYGFCGLYRGISVLLYITAPKQAIRFGTFEFLKTFFVDSKGYLSLEYNALCGFIAGLTEAVLAVTPGESIKVKLIDDRRSEKPRYKGFFQGVIMIIKEYGIKGIYKGVVPTMIKQSTNQMIRFSVTEFGKILWRGTDPKVIVPKWLTALFGAIAGATSVVANTPIDVVKTRMQGLEGVKYKNVFNCIKQIMVEEGCCAFYKGTISRMSRVVIDVAFTFAVYDIIHEMLDLLWT